MNYKTILVRTLIPKITNRNIHEGTEVKFMDDEAAKNAQRHRQLSLVTVEHGLLNN
jgi:hypothetical protein